ncbi:cob(I)yrinic acid a,c-diamide adenosyltransferase [Candidatus Wolfebacteria bacterium]|nr:cob(I)yrinic acid a,c-diamide adenosyltransferase [Candidatus Wolfebacteria bacterium]
MLYTRKGDNGTTKFFGCDQRMTKSSERAEALGAVDEVNSLLGLVKVKAESEKLDVGGLVLEEIIEAVQQDLFIVQAILGGAPKTLGAEKVLRLEQIVDSLEKEMPPIKTFFLAGGTEVSALFDYARAVSRRVERRVVALSERDPLPAEVLQYMNRLSSLLYAFARWVNLKTGVEQIPPSYE